MDNPEYEKPSITRKDLTEKEYLEAHDSRDVEKNPDESHLISIAKKNHICHKLVHTLSLATLVVLCLSITKFQFFIPYYYTIVTPCLLIIRCVLYWKNKWQYFMIDFCYFANIFTYVFIWAFPGSPEAALVMFALSNGPLVWATIMYRNSLVLHDTDRLTSCFIHIMPVLLSYCLRWFPAETSLHWYTPYNTVYSEDLVYIAVWMIAVPSAAYVVHMLLYLLLIVAICRPSEEYWSSYRYMMNPEPDSWKGRLIKHCGQGYSLCLYVTFNLVYCALSLSLAVLMYKFYIAHAISIAIVMLVVIGNGASYYMDVFAKRGFASED